MSRKTPDWTMEVIDEKIIEGQMIVTFDRALQDIDRALSMVSPDLNTRVELLENRRNLTKQRREVAEAYQERQRKYNHNYYNGYFPPDWKRKSEDEIKQREMALLR